MSADEAAKHSQRAERQGPVPPEFIAYDAEGHVIDTRSGGRLVARGAVSWPERFNGCPECHPQGQGWYHPAALIPPGYGAVLVADTGEAYSGSEQQLDRYVARRRDRDCDLCGEPFAERGGPHDCGEDGQLCTRCRDLPEAHGE